MNQKKKAARSKTKSKQSHQSSEMQIDRDYVAGLLDYCLDRPRTALEHISKAISEHPKDEALAAMYRLWIEILAEDRDIVALTELQSHLESRCLNDTELSSEQKQDLYALRTLIHFEKDELDAVALWVKASENMKYKNQSIYFQELKISWMFRTGSLEAKDLSAAIRSTSINFPDYFSLLRMVSCSKNLALDSIVDKAISILEEVYPFSPMRLELDYSQAFSNQNYEDAEEIAVALMQNFPGVRKYETWNILTSLLSGNYIVAMQKAKKFLNRYGEKDAEINMLLATALSKLALQSGGESELKQALELLFKSKKILSKDWNLQLPIELYLHELQSKIHVNANDDLSNKRFWFVSLNQSQYAEFQNSSEEELSYLTKRIHENASTGDLCFILAPSYEGSSRQASQSFRFLAIYTVMDQPSLSAWSGYESNLKLMLKFPYSVPVDINVPASQKVNQSAYHVFECSVEAIEILSLAAEQRLGEHDVATTYLRGIERAAS